LLSCAKRAALGLDFSEATSAQNGSEFGAYSWETVTQTEQNRVPAHDSYTETAEPSFGMEEFFLRRFCFSATLTPWNCQDQKEAKNQAEEKFFA